MKQIAILVAVICITLGTLWFAVGFSGEQQSRPDQAKSPQASSPLQCRGEQLPELTEGPYYKASSPQRQTIREEGIVGVPLVLEGYVLDTSCQPITNAWIDFWQADGNGAYDNAGYRLRGHHYTDEQGRYRLETVIPGQYPGRTEHIHFKIRASDSSESVTSQLFFPDGGLNTEDTIFHETLIMTVKDAPEGTGKYATYDFVIER